MESVSVRVVDMATPQRIFAGKASMAWSAMWRRGNQELSSYPQLLKLMNSFSLQS
jgi:hypothetical protein